MPLAAFGSDVCLTAIERAENKELWHFRGRSVGLGLMDIRLLGGGQPSAIILRYIRKKVYMPLPERGACASILTFYFPYYLFVVVNYILGLCFSKLVAAHLTAWY